MRPIKWETVKRRAMSAAGIECANAGFMNRAAPYALQECVADGRFDWRARLEELRDMTRARIAGWDVRRARSLHRLFPDCLPQDCRYELELRDDGEWWVNA